MEPSRRVCTALRFARKLGQLVLALGVFHFSCMMEWFPVQDKGYRKHRQTALPTAAQKAPGLSHVGFDVDTFGRKPALSRRHVNQQTG
jgi:hypothetical protein